MKSPNVNWDKLESLLKEKFGVCYYVKGDTEIVTVCPLCETHKRKKHTHGHLYICTGDDNLTFWCFKCNTKGNIVSLIKGLGVNLKEYISDELSKRRWVKRARNTTNLLDTSSVTYNFEEEKHNIIDDRFRYKRDYLKGRLGYDIDIDSVPNLIFNFRNFVNVNNIKLTDYDNNRIAYLDDSFIGFLCNRGTIAIFRNVTGDETNRYIKINLFPGQETAFNDFYGIQSEYISNSNNIKPNKIVLCEGIFDLLVPYYSNELYGLKSETSVWACVLGKSFYATIPSILDYYYMIKSNFVILSDNDVEDKFYNRFSKHPQVENLQVVRNKLGKDFGAYPISPSINVFQKNVFGTRRRK